MREGHSNFLSVNEECGAWIHGEIGAGDPGNVGPVPLFCVGKLLAEEFIKEVYISFRSTRMISGLEIMP
jgi:hypothetical protein